MDPGRWIDWRVARYRREMEAALRRSLRDVRTALRDADMDGAKLAANADNLELARRLGDELAREVGSDLDGLRREWRAAVRELVAVVGDDLARSGIGEEFTRQGRAGLAFQKGSGLDRIVSWATKDMAENSADLRSDLRENIVRMMREPHAPSVVTRRIAAEIGGSEARALALIDTSLSGVDRASTAVIAREVGVEWFLYDGPQDAITRPWCSPRIGRRFTMAQMDEVPNDSGPNPPSVFGGGFNCRHRWTPLQREADMKRFRPWRG